MSKPGKDAFRYDNLGYIVASLVIERVTGQLHGEPQPLSEPESARVEFVPGTREVIQFVRDRCATPTR